MADAENPTPAAAVVSNVVIEVPGAAEGTTVTAEFADIPPENRAQGLAKFIDGYVRNRVNSYVSRFKKANEAYANWDAFEAAMAKDPLQTEVPRPNGDKPKEEDRPKAIDYVEKANEAVKALIDGTAFNERVAGEKKPPRDPLVKAVTDSLVRRKFDAMKAENASAKWTDAVSVIGSDGIAYLNAQIEERVASVAEADRDATRKALEKQRDETYINPARIMLGLQPAKGKGDGLAPLL